MKKTLLLVSQIAIFFMGLFGGFLRRIAPPDDQGQFWTGLATAIAGGVFLIVRLRSQSLNEQDKERIYYRIALCILPLSIICFVSYHALSESRTAHYVDTVRIIGTELTPKARMLKEVQSLSNDELLLRNAGDPHGIWTDRSITTSRNILGWAYSLSVALFALGLIGGCEGLKGT